MREIHGETLPADTIARMRLVKALRTPLAEYEFPIADLTENSGLVQGRVTEIGIRRKRFGPRVKIVFVRLKNRQNLSIVVFLTYRQWLEYKHTIHIGRDITACVDQPPRPYTAFPLSSSVPICEQVMALVTSEWSTTLEKLGITSDQLSEIFSHPDEEDPSEGEE